MKDYTVTEEINKYLIGSTIIDSFVADQEVGFEGGLTVIFEKDNQRGILIYGYTEIGEWLEYLQVGKVKINDFEKSFILMNIIKLN